MYCTKCRNEIKNSDIFCSKCGTPTSNNKESLNDELELSNVPTEIIPKIGSCEKCGNPKRLVFQNGKNTYMKVCLNCDTKIVGTCPICKQKLSTEKAEQCDVCKCSWYKEIPQAISLNIENTFTTVKEKIKCPKCSSEEITSDKKGFSGKQAVGGAILTGGIGILAGTIGSNKIIITCLACGNQFKPGDKPATIQRKNTQSEKGAIVFVYATILFFIIFIIVKLVTS